VNRRVHDSSCWDRRTLKRVPLRRKKVAQNSFVTPEFQDALKAGR
jgi:hypothetical protein